MPLLLQPLPVLLLLLLLLVTIIISCCSNGSESTHCHVLPLANNFEYMEHIDRGQKCPFCALILRYEMLF